MSGTPLRVVSRACGLGFAAALLWSAPVLAQIERPQIIASYPHDPDAFTQGLLLHDGRLFESTGLTGRSTLRRVTLASGAVERSVSLASNLFGEGLALVDNRLIQLTWQNQVALVYDLDFNSLGSFDYTGEGWGICHDGVRLVMSDGTARLSFRDPESFALLGGVEVTRDGTPVTRLNELECVGRLVYANVWQTDTIVRIDPASGTVLTTIDAANLLTADEAAAAEVLNGIAFDEQSGHFFLTGKLWPKLFEVRFDFDPRGGESPGPDAALDAGQEAGKDASSVADAAGGSGGVSVIDAGGAGGTGAEPLPNNTVHSPSDSGCGCRFSARGASSGFWLTVIAMLLYRARRTMLA